ncbi:MAG: hypothetical protein ACI915_005425 [Gammaproteobacteria bacterium]|jgi:hypothetical protein
MVFNFRGQVVNTGIRNQIDKQTTPPDIAEIVVLAGMAGIDQLDSFQWLCVLKRLLLPFVGAHNTV